MDAFAPTENFKYTRLFDLNVFVANFLVEIGHCPLHLNKGPARESIPKHELEWNCGNHAYCT